MTDVPKIVKLSFSALKDIALYFMAFWWDLARQLMNKLSLRNTTKITLWVFRSC